MPWGQRDRFLAAASPFPTHTRRCPLRPGPALTARLAGVGSRALGPSTIPDSPSCAAPGPQPVPSAPQGSATLRTPACGRLHGALPAAAAEH